MGAKAAKAKIKRLMGISERVWNALTSMIKLEDKVIHQSKAIKTQQAKIEHLIERVIRLETTLDLLLRAQGLKRLKKGEFMCC